MSFDGDFRMWCQLKGRPDPRQHLHELGGREGCGGAPSQIHGLDTAPGQRTFLSVKLDLLLEGGKVGSSPVFTMDAHIECTKVAPAVAERNVDVETNGHDAPVLISVELRLAGGQISCHSNLDFVLRRQATVADVHGPERVAPQRIKDDFEEFRLNLIFPVPEPGIMAA